MFGGPDGMRRIMSQESIKPKRLGETFARFGAYFKPFWPVLLLVTVLVISATWAQVTTPELIGQVVDCYLTPAASSSFGSFPGAQEGECRRTAGWRRAAIQAATPARSSRAW
jgi:ATP-binding cassette subfamily B protein